MKNTLRILAACLLATLSAHAQTNTTWLGGTNAWNSANWSAGAPINATFNAIINSGTVTLDAGYTISALTMGNSTITGAQTLATSGVATLAGSSILTGGMTLQVNGGLSITSGPSFNNAIVNVPAGQTATFTAANSTLGMSNGATINNAGTWLTQGNGTISGGAGVKTFNNTGTFTRNTAAGTHQVSATFNNSGIVNVSTGTLDLFSGGASTGGVFNVAGGATLRFGNGHTFDGATFIQGAGSAIFAPSSGTTSLAHYDILGTTNIAGSVPAILNFNDAAGSIGALTGTGSAIANFNGAASPTSVSVGGNTFNFANNVSTSTVALANGLLTIASGKTFDMSGALTLGGTLGGAGVFNANAGGSFTSGGLTGTTLNIPSGQTFTNGGFSTFNFASSATLNNAGTYFAQNGNGIFGGSGTNVVNNSGTFTRNTSAGTFQISARFNNTGIVNANTGTLDLFSGGTSTGGVFNVASGATLRFGGAHTFDSNTFIQGAGSAIFAPSAGTATISHYDIGTGTTIAGSTPGTINFNDPIGNMGVLTGTGSAIANFNGTASPTSVSVGGNTFNFANNVSTGAVSLANGVLTIASGKTFDINGTLTLQGTLGGPGVFNANAGGGFVGGGLSATTLNLPAGQTFTNGGFNSFSFASSSTFNNSGTYLAQNGFGITNGAGTNVFNNLPGSVFTRDTNAGSFTVSSAFNNASTVNANTGTLWLQGGGTATNGAFNIANGATLILGAAQTFNAASSITGVGTAKAIFSNSGTLNVTNYSVTGTTQLGFSGGGGVTNLNNGAGSIGAVVGMLPGTINFNGTASPTSVTTSGGALLAFFNDATTATLVASNEGQVNVAPGKTLNVLGATTMFGGAGGRGRFGGGGVVLASGGFSTSGEGILDTGILTIPVGATAVQAAFSDHISARNGSTINNAGTWRAQSSAIISINGTGPNVFNNSGTLLHDTSAAIAFIDIDTLNTGLVTAPLGQLTFSRSFIQTAGEFRATTTGQLNFSPGSSAFGAFNGGQITGAGNISGPAVVAGATVAPAGILNFISGRGDLTTTVASTIAIDIGGTTPGAGHDQITEAGLLPFTRNGTLAVRFAGGFQNAILPTDTFTVITSNQATLGQFANVSAGRIATADGHGTFAINFGTNSVILSVYIPHPDIAVEQPASTPLVDGAATVDFGTGTVGGTSALTFTLGNTGAGTLTGIAATLSGANAGDFSVTTPPPAMLAPGGSATFVVTFTPGNTGPRIAALQIASNDPDEGPFDIALTGGGNFAPVLVLPPSPLLVEATGPAGAVATFAVSATDVEDDPDPAASATPASGGTFAIGDTTVAVTATDSDGATTNGAFIVRVRDTTGPVVDAHANATVEAMGPGGAVVLYAPATASDAVGVTSLTYSQNSGTLFPIGTTVVTVTARDAANNMGTTTFTVTVADTTAPMVTPPANVTVEAMDATGATVTYPAATASDAVGVTSLTYSQNSGTLFPIGTTVVTVTARDAANNTGTATFTVAVVDTTAPVVFHGAVIAEATGPAGAVVTYAAATATDAVGVTGITYSQNSGTLFPIGTTNVTATARDAANNMGTVIFAVTVQDTIAPLIAGPFSPLSLTAAPGVGGMAALPDYTAQAVTSDAVGVTSVTQSPAVGTTHAPGTVLVTLIAADAAGNSTPITFTVTVIQGNQPPTAISLAGTSVAENEPAATNVGVLTGTDADAGQVLSFTLVSGPGDAGNGGFSIVNDAGIWRLITAASFDFETQPTRSIRVRVTDDGTVPMSHEENFIITVTDVTLPQTITFTPPATATTTDTLALTATGGASGEPVTFIVVSGPGVLAGNSLSFSSTGTVFVRASQAAGGDYSAAANVNATILIIVNTAPIFADDAVTITTGDATVYPLANDRDPDSDVLTIASVSEPGVIISDRALIIPAGYTGTFSYTATDGTSTGTADVVVTSGAAVTGARRYTGLLRDAAGGIVGSVTVNHSPKNIATAKILLGTRRGKAIVPLRTLAPANGGGASSLGNLALALSIDGRITATLAGNAGTFTGSLRPAITSATAQKYNIALASIDSAIPGGGYAIARVKTNGGVKVTLRLPDRRGAVAGTVLGDNGTISFFTLQRKQSAPSAVLGGELILSNLTATDVTGEIAWSRPTQIPPTGAYSGGVDTVLTANGCLYNGTIPLDGISTLTVTGDLFDVPLSASVRVGSGIPQITGPIELWLAKIETGIFRAEIRPTDFGTPIGVVGIYLPKSHTAWGYFTNASVFGHIELRQE